MTKSKFLIIPLFVFLIVLPYSVSAYTFNGYRWFQWPWTTVAVDFNPAGRTANETNANRNAMLTWGNAGARFKYVENSGAVNGITYYYEKPGAMKIRLAVTDVYNGWAGYIQKIRVNVNTFFSWATDGNYWSGYDVQSLMTHELGHGVGLDHNTADSDTTMWPETTYGDIKQRSLEADDKNGVQALYGKS